MTGLVSRRDFLRISGMGGTLAALAACNPLRPSRTLEVGATAIPPAAPILDHEGLILHTLRRMTFGPTAAELETATRIGLEAWLEQQLAADSSDAPEVEERLAEFETLKMSPIELRDLQENGRVARELGGSAVLRQIYSPNQLFEVMVDFWTNHFNIFAYSPPELFLKGIDDREVIRAHALGKFPDMLTASSHSPAMLVYLDNAQSRQPSPNENYAREIFELHALGVDGGYTYADIQALARAFTGWSVGGFRRRTDPPGEFVYLPNWHDTDPKIVLGQELPGRKGDGDRALKILAEHPSTARFIATKLSQRFVSDAPGDSLIDQVAETYSQTDGDIPAMLRTIIYADEFAASAGLKLKRPLDFAVSAIRAIGIGIGLQASLRGPVSAAALQSIADFHLPGNPQGVRVLQQTLSSLYGLPAEDLSLFQGLSSQAATTFEAMDLLAGLDPAGYQPSGGAAYPEDDFGQGLSQIALLAKSELGLEIACIDIGGWDTHIQQGAEEGRMPQLMASVAGGLAAFHQDMRKKMNDVTVVTLSEFGRRVAENGSGGTDHGHGGVMFVMGGGILGGKVYGEWPGLAPENLYGPGDLAITTDFREVLAEIVLKRLKNDRIDEVFPGYRAGGFLGLASPRKR